MHLDLRHLRTIAAIHEHGGLGRAAEVLNLTQSALSHQLKAMEAQAGVPLVVRRARPLRLTAAGLRLLRTAEAVLPLIANAEAEFRDVEKGRAGRLHVAMECHACFDWLLPVMDRFRRNWPDVDIDIRAGLAFQALPALVRETADLVITSDPEPLEGITYQPLFDYAPTLVVPAGHPLVAKGYAEAADFADLTLIHYPMDRARLDIFSHLLTPAKVEPAALREVEQTAVALMLVAAGRGVTVMPDWVVRREAANPELAFLPMTRTGLRRRMYAALRTEALALPYMAHFLRLARTDSLQLQSSD
ncbi:LysR family transcriptional regulator [Paracoccus suum]|uniref:HTH-type transcriptional regulator MetR n=1 Tax=Paracoccus suum TaxID=2259340 RepID=A0A344PH80_9RHOB|nr:LysR family transcriptional regulator [Paracoccus suum]AXC48735.1 LysR family transcriptional regulator [Paracoccus suum]